MQQYLVYLLILIHLASALPTNYDDHHGTDGVTSWQSMGLGKVTPTVSAEVSIGSTYSAYGEESKVALTTPAVYVTDLVDKATEIKAKEETYNGTLFEQQTTQDGAQEGTEARSGVGNISESPVPTFVGLANGTLVEGSANDTYEESKSTKGEFMEVGKSTNEVRSTANVESSEENGSSFEGVDSNTRATGVEDYTTEPYLVKEQTSGKDVGKAPDSPVPTDPEVSEDELVKSSTYAYEEDPGKINNATIEVAGKEVVVTDIISETESSKEVGLYSGADKTTAVAVDGYTTEAQPVEEKITATDNYNDVVSKAGSGSESADKMANTMDDGSLSESGASLATISIKDDYKTEVYTGQSETGRGVGATSVSPVPTDMKPTNGAPLESSTSDAVENELETTSSDLKEIESTGGGVTGSMIEMASSEDAGLFSEDMKSVATAAVEEDYATEAYAGEEKTTAEASITTPESPVPTDRAHTDAAFVEDAISDAVGKQLTTASDDLKEVEGDDGSVLKNTADVGSTVDAELYTESMDLRPTVTEEEIHPVTGYLVGQETTKGVDEEETTVVGSVGIGSTEAMSTNSWSSNTDVSSTVAAGEGASATTDDLTVVLFEKDGHEGNGSAEGGTTERDGSDGIGLHLGSANPMTTAVLEEDYTTAADAEEVET
ncbi:unnamed protein product, partial [Hydatigera taeniaeformis]|uniref:Fibroin heavy chain-like n=1 Tax=Hydatigena taeniaeformis TaxID=6205 RepID=A0A0R3X7V8_HYDTA